MKHLLPFGLAFLLSVLLCNSSSVGAGGDVSTDELLSAPEEIDRDGCRYTWMSFSGETSCRYG